jgi:hypothetical protein
MVSDEPSKLRMASAADLIDQLNPKIRGWRNYHRHVVSKRTFGRVDHNIFSSLWKWARRRHPNKSPRTTRHLGLYESNETPSPNVFLVRFPSLWRS